MKHLGDITKINGAAAPIVDVIIGGSPCQDLSVAGKRAGLAGERSGLYMEQIRIIKEMRNADVLRGRTDELIRPRYMVWENVPGAFSSNKGQDFAAVLEEAIRVAEPEAPSVSVPDKGWPTSGCLFDVDGRWSVAWRVLDAQFWGVPQRRRRIALVADFGGISAPEILFIRKGVSGHSEPGKPKGKAVAGDVGEGTGGAVPCTLKIRGGCSERGKGALIRENKSATLSTLQDRSLFQPVTYCLQGSGATSQNSQGIGYKEDKSYTLNTLDVHGVAYSIENHPGDGRVDIDESGKVQTLTSRIGTGGGNVPMVMEHVTFADVASTLRSGAGAPKHESDFVERLVSQPIEVPRVAHTLRAKSNCDFRKDSETYIVAGVDCRNCTELPEMNATMQAKTGGGFSLNCNQVVRVKHIVRRLTTLECERLQGYPDGWTDIGEWTDSKGKLHKPADSPRYKALGNSIAIPPWKWVLKRLCAWYERDATMASLFDGIGGFPYIWEQLNGNGSCLWASEIEEFPMAITKVRFGE